MQQKLAVGLGWFSIALGLTEVMAPRQLGKFFGVRQHEDVIRLCGFREIAAGVGLLGDSRKAPWLWARVAGDAVDLALLWSATSKPRARRDRLTMAAVSVAAVTAL